MFVRNHDAGWVVHARAKINLALEIVGRRPDGYHQLETLLTAVCWCDTVHLEPADRFSLTVRRCEPTRWLREMPLATTEDNLVAHAARRLAEASGHPLTGRFTLVKRIASQAGLGGGSSDAAAALMLANRAWELGYTPEQLAPIAAEVGVDVPFFLARGAAIGTDRGDNLERVAIPSGMPLVIVQPSFGLSTPEVFAQLGLARGEQAKGFTGGCRQLAEALAKGLSPARWRGLVRNGLQSAAELLTDGIERITRSLDGLGAVACQMTGSGSAVFVLCRTWREAIRLAAWLRGQSGLFALATRTCP